MCCLVPIILTKDGCCVKVVVRLHFCRQGNFVTLPGLHPLQVLRCLRLVPDSNANREKEEEKKPPQKKPKTSRVKSSQAKVGVDLRAKQLICLANLTNIHTQWSI